MGFRDNIRRVIPYTPGEQPRERVIKLNTNECPYPPSPRVIKAMKELDWERLRLYPDPLMADFTESLAEYYGVKPSQVFGGVGSDDVLSMCFLTFFSGDRPVLFPDITYSFYDVWAEVYRIPYETKKLDDDFRIVPSDYYAENGGIVLANPNAPTGIRESLAVMEDIIDHNRDSVVIVDEAYIDFGAESALPLIDKYENLVVVRTMSKSRALAGMRLGYCFGSEELIKYLNDVKYSVNSYTLNIPAITAGAAAIRDQGYFDKTVSRIKKTREWTAENLEGLGFSFFRSDTNFIFAKPPEGFPAANIFERLKKHGIYVRHFGKERISDYLRITIGTDEEMETLIDTLKIVIKEM